jgi:hypothetical protein
MSCAAAAGGLISTTAAKRCLGSFFTAISNMTATKRLAMILIRAATAKSLNSGLQGILILLLHVLAVSVHCRRHSYSRREPSKLAPLKCAGVTYSSPIIIAILWSSHPALISPRQRTGIGANRIKATVAHDPVPGLLTLPLATALITL